MFEEIHINHTHGLRVSLSRHLVRLQGLRRTQMLRSRLARSRLPRRVHTSRPSSCSSSASWRRWQPPALPPLPPPLMWGARCLR